MDSSDPFAQTGAQHDDLFDDMTVLSNDGEESMQTRAPDDLFGDDFTPIAEPVIEQQFQGHQQETAAGARKASAPATALPPQAPTFYRGRGSHGDPPRGPSGRGAGRGRGGAEGGRGRGAGGAGEGNRGRGAGEGGRGRGGVEGGRGRGAGGEGGRGRGGRGRGDFSGSQRGGAQNRQDAALVSKSDSAAASAPAPVASTSAAAEPAVAAASASAAASAPAFKVSLGQSMHAPKQDKVEHESTATNDAQTQSDQTTSASLPPKENGVPTNPETLTSTAQPAPASEEAAPAATATIPKSSTSTSTSTTSRPGAPPSRPKLTDTELAEKISRIQLKNASLTAAHERAEADAASFAQREEAAASRRKEERRDRAQMMGEREKNRLRKLKAQGGREWDEGKAEAERNRRSAPAGAGAGAGAGTDEYDDGRQYIYREDRGRGSGRGRGDRGRGRGRGGRDGAGQAAAGSGRQNALPPPGAAEFPDLPAATSGAGAGADADAGAGAGRDGQTGSSKAQNGTGVGVTPVLSFPAKGGARQDARKDGVDGGEKWADMVEEEK